LPAPQDTSVRRVKTFFASFFHDEPSDDRALLMALRTLRGHQRDRYDLSVAFEDVLGSDVEPGFMTQLVREYANRAATSDDQAREWVVRMRDEAALDDVYEPDE
jgi:hypothetical protein